MNFTTFDLPCYELHTSDTFPFFQKSRTAVVRTKNKQQQSFFLFRVYGSNALTGISQFVLGLMESAWVLLLIWSEVAREESRCGGLSRADGRLDCNHQLLSIVYRFYE